MEPPPPPEPPPSGGRDPLSAFLSGDGLSALRKRLRLDRMDAGELLLLLLVLYLLIEGEELEPLLAVGLVLVFSLLDGEEK